MKHIEYWSPCTYRPVEELTIADTWEAKELVELNISKILNM